jgi:hypothetical protein
MSASRLQRCVKEEEEDRRRPEEVMHPPSAFMKQNLRTRDHDLSHKIFNVRLQVFLLLKKN